MGAPVVHFELNARDGKRAQDFYAALFEWKIDANNPMNYGLVNTGTKKGIGGGIGQAQSNMPPGPMFYVEVEDLVACLAKAESMGARTVVPITEIPNMVTYAVFSDPDGLNIGLIKSMPPPKKAAPRRKAKPAKKRARPKARAKKSRRR